MALSRCNGRVPISPHVNNKPYTVGPTLDVLLPWRFSVETGLLYQRLHQDFNIGLVVGRGNNYVNFGQSGSVGANAWLFPFLLRSDLSRHRLTRFIEAGATLRHAGDYTGQGIQLDFYLHPQPATFNFPSPKSLDAAITAGAGFRTRILDFNIAPEIRYLHWTSAANQPTRDQAMLLLDITFPARK